MKLVNVSMERFWEYVEKNSLTQVPGNIFHSDNYLNEKGEVMAYRESSSWNNHVIYQIMTEENEETINLVKNIMYGK